jgi:hypothetical protein
LHKKFDALSIRKDRDLSALLGGNKEQLALGTMAEESVTTHSKVTIRSSNPQVAQRDKRASSMLIDVAAVVRFATIRVAASLRPDSARHLIQHRRKM